MNYYSYDQPLPGLNEKGEEVTCNQRVIVNELDAIRLMRYALSVRKDLDYAMTANKQTLLSDFICIHLAQQDHDRH